MPTLTNAREGLEIIRDALQAAITADTTSFPSGADIVLLDEEPTEPESAGIPYIVLSETSDSYSEDWGMREVQATAVAKANGYNGGTFSEAANPVMSHNLLSAALVEFIESEYETLNAAGVQGVEVDGPRIQPATVNDLTIQTATHSVVFRYER